MNKKKISEASVMSLRWMFEMCSPHLEMKLYDVGKLHCLGLILPMIGNMSLPCLCIKTSNYMVFIFVLNALIED